MLSAYPDLVREEHRRAQQRVAIAALEDVIERSGPSVRTGAYRVSHALWSGQGEPSTQRFLDPAAPGSDEVVSYQGFPEFEAPDLVEAALDLDEAEFGETIFVRNTRFYAEWLEYGTSRMDGKFIYEAAVGNAQARAEIEARRAEEAIAREAENTSR
jgi:hypothetical protein